MASNDDPPSQQGTGGGGGEQQQQQQAAALAFDAPTPPQPLREDYVQNAVKFLSHPKVKGSPVVYRRSFLEKKGLTTDEIDEAFRRVPDPQPTAASPSTQTQPPAAPVQPYASSSVQPAAGPITLATAQPRFSWYRAFLAAGLLLGFGASAAVFIKKLLIPRLKSWIRKVVAEGDESNELKSKIDDETKEAVKASASAVSAIAKTNQELLASKDEEKKILATLTQALDSQAKVLKSLSESLSHNRDSINITREDRFSHYRPLEEPVPSTTRNGSVNSPWRAPQPNMYGVPNSDFGSGRPSFAPASSEPMPGSFSRSYVEQTVQRGDRASGSKPWEMQQYSQTSLGYGSNSHLNDDGSYSEAQENYGPSYHQNGKAHFQEEEPRPLAYSSGVEERPPPQRRWVPPQPPGVTMPEAAAAIRQPKSLAKQSSSETSEVGAEVQVNGAPSSSSVATELPANGGAASEAGRSEIEEQAEAI